MTPDQLRLARAALDLPNTSGRSTRNKPFHAGPAEDAFWRLLNEMVDAGLMRKRQRTTLRCGFIHEFTLTRAGADRALEPGERLDPQQFPQIGAI